MNKKTLVQYVLYLLVFVILFAFFNTYFSNKKVEPKLETKEVIPNDQIIELQYLSSDADGNTYLIKAESGTTSSENKDIINLSNVSAKITLINNEEDLFLVKRSGNTQLKIDKEGLLSIKEFGLLPTPVEGGIAYFDNNFYLGLG